MLTQFSEADNVKWRWFSPSVTSGIGAPDSATVHDVAAANIGSRRPGLRLGDPLGVHLACRVVSESCVMLTTAKHPGLTPLADSVEQYQSMPLLLSSVWWRRLVSVTGCIIGAADSSACHRSTHVGTLGCGFGLVRLLLPPNRNRSFGMAF